MLFWVIYKIYVLIKYNVYVNYIVKCVNFMIMFIKLKLLYFWWNSFLSIYDFRFLVRFILESYCMDMKDDFWNCWYDVYVSDYWNIIMKYDYE